MMDLLVRRPVWIFTLAVVTVFPIVESLPSPPDGRHYAYDFEIDFDQPDLGSHHRERRRSGRGNALDSVDCGNITGVPDDLRTDIGLDDFYQKYTHAYGIPILSSNISQDAALTRACYVVRFMLADREDLRNAMYDYYGRVAVIASTERTTQIPEHSYLNGDFWDSRARGLGGTRQVPVTSNGEENILCRRQEDRWHEQDILIHEFAHAVHLISLKAVDSTFDQRLQNVYDMARADNLWQYTYAITKKTEYFAEGVQAFFNVQVCRSFIDGINNEICTRQLLKDYDWRLYDLITEVFPCMNTVVDRCNNDQGLAANQILRMNCELVGNTTEAITTMTSTTEVTTTEVTTSADTTTLATSLLLSTADTVTVSVTGTIATDGPVTTTGMSFCPETTLVDADAGSLTWPMTGAGSLSESVEVCPLETQHAGLPRAVRNCSMADGPNANIQWDVEYEVRGCGGYRDPSTITLEDLAQVEVSSGNVVEVSQFLADLTTVNSTGPKQLNLMLSSLAKVLQNVVAAESGDTEVAHAVLQTVNNVIISLSSGQVTGKDDPKSRSSVVKSFQTQVGQTLRLKGSISLQETVVQVEAVSVNQSEAADGLGFASVQSSESADASVSREGSLDETRIQIFADQSELSASDVVASVRLPGSELDQADVGKNSKLSAVFTIYQDDTLFPSALKPGISVGGAVIAVAVQDTVLQNLTDPVVIQYKTPVALSEKTLQETKCVFWDFNLEEGMGDWSEDGCVLAEVTNEMTVCHCDHLTNFAILVGDATNGGDFQQALHVISQISCAICIILLSITLIVNICIRPQDDSQQGSYVDISRPIFMQLCAALLVLYIVFLAGIDGDKGSEGGCVFVAALLHYLTLVSVMLMVIDAWDLYYAVREEPLQNKRLSLILGAVVLAWGVPLIIVAITVPTALSFYTISSDDLNSVMTYCFLKPGLAMYLGLLLPIGLFLAHNITVFILVGRSLRKAQKKFDTRNISQRLQNAVGISALTLLTWLFGILAIASAAVGCLVMVLLTATSQGVFIFIVFCIRRREVRDGVLTGLIRLHVPTNHGKKYDVKRRSVQLETQPDALPVSPLEIKMDQKV